MIGQCAREAGVHLDATRGCTCVPWREHTAATVRARLANGTCAFLQWPNSPGSVGGPFKDLVPLLKSVHRPPAIVHQLQRLV